MTPHDFAAASRCPTLSFSMRELRITEAEGQSALRQPLPAWWSFVLAKKQGDERKAWSQMFDNIVGQIQIAAESASVHRRQRDEAEAEIVRLRQRLAALGDFATLAESRRRAADIANWRLAL